MFDYEKAFYFKYRKYYNKFLALESKKRTSLKPESKLGVEKETRS